MPCQERLEAYLHNQQVAFQIQHHKRVFTALEVAICRQVPSRMVAKVVIVQGDSRKICLVLPASTRVDFHQVHRYLRTKKTRLAREVELVDLFPDCEIGAMPPFGNLYDLQVCVEQSLAKEETIVFLCGTHAETMNLRYSDFERLVSPKVMPFAEV